jgi:Protein of unknown function (DUF1015)
VVEGGRLGRPRGPGIVVHGDCVEQLGQHVSGQTFCTLLDQAQAQMHMAEELSLVRGQEERAAVELEEAADVVEKRGGHEQVAPQALVELGDVAADRRDRDRVLEEAAGVGVMRVRCGGQYPQARAQVDVTREASHERVQLRMGDLRGEKLEEAVELLDVTTGFRHQGRRIRLRRLERPHLELQAVTEALDPSEDVHRVPFPEALVEELDVAPDPRIDAPARIDELEREIGAPAAGTKALLAGDRIGALDDPVLCQLRDRHGAILGPASAASLAAMPLVKPFRALRFAPGAAGSLDELVSPPYDVISPQLHDRLLAASPYNSVRLVRPDDPAEAARLLAQWQRDGILVREEEPAAWLLEEDFVGPDGVARIRRSLVARAVLEPFERGVVLPHERSFPKPRRGRLRLLEATRTKMSPIMLLHEGDGPPPAPDRPPDLEAALDGVTSRLWRLDPSAAAGIKPPLVIADGHHRYEAALRFHEEDGTEETGYVLAALVGVSDPGLTIFPTHRLSSAPPPDLDGSFRLIPAEGPNEALATLDSLPRDRAAFAVLGPDLAVVAQTDSPDLDTAVVDRFPLGEVRFTPSADEAARAVAAGEAGSAFLVRPPTVTEVEELARAGVRMPEKSTYFYPKLVGGLLFSPFDE